MPPRALMKSMSTHTMVFMAGSTPPCTTPAPSHPVFLAHLLVAQVHKPKLFEGPHFGTGGRVGLQGRRAAPAPRVQLWCPDASLRLKNSIARNPTTVAAVLWRTHARGTHARQKLENIRFEGGRARRS